MLLKTHISRDFYEKQRDKSSWSARRVFCQQQSTFTRMRRFTHWQHGVGLPLFARIFRRKKTEINHGVENLAKYVITCGNWGHKWRHWKYLSHIVIISDRAMGCHYFLAYHIFMWVSIYSVLSGIVGLFERKKPPLSFSMIPTPFKAYRLPHCAPNTYKCTDRFHTQSYRVKKGSILFAQYSIGRRKNNSAFVDQKQQT